MRTRRILTVVGLLAFLAAEVLGVWVWVVSANSPTHYADLFDEFALPGSWELVHVEIKAPGVDWCVPGIGVCPSVTRYYLADADPANAFETMRQVVTEAGFQQDNGLGGGCRQDGSTTTCVLPARRGADHLWIVILDRGESDTYIRGSEGYRVGAPNRALIRITAAPTY